MRSAPDAKRPAIEACPRAPDAASGRAPAVPERYTDAARPAGFTTGLDAG